MQISHPSYQHFIRNNLLAAAKRHETFLFIKCFLKTWQNVVFVWQFQLLVTWFMRAWAYIMHVYHRFTLQHLFSLQLPLSKLTSSLRFNANCSGPVRHPPQLKSASLCACRCIPYTCIIISRKHWKRETAGEADATQSNKDGPDWKDPGRWQSRLVSI